MSRGRATALESFWMGFVARLPCLVCARTQLTSSRVQVHHVAEGSGPASNFSVVPLCEEHHDPNRTGSGFHGMGTERFCKLFRVPGESEYGLFVWLAEEIANYLKRRIGWALYESKR